MRAGGIIGIPLTLLQWGVHQHTGAVVDPLTIANNFVVCHAVYDADRFDPVTSPEWMRWTTRVAAVASTAFYASDPHTLVLAPLVPPLHLYYARTKPAIAPIKPFAVAALWTTAVYAVPLLRGTDAHGDAAAASALWLSLAALSHAADVMDMVEDEADGLRTPAVQMTDAEARRYAVALAFAAAVVDVSASTHPSPLYDAFVGLAAWGVAYGQIGITVALGIGWLAWYVVHHDYEIVSALLRSTESSHRLAIDSSTRLVEFALSLDEPWRTALIEPTLAAVRGGDAVGRAILDVYEHTIRDELTRPPRW